MHQLQTQNPREIEGQRVQSPHDNGRGDQQYIGQPEPVKSTDEFRTPQEKRERSSSSSRSGRSSNKFDRYDKGGDGSYYRGGNRGGGNYRGRNRGGYGGYYGGGGGQGQTY